MRYERPEKQEVSHLWHLLCNSWACSPSHPECDLHVRHRAWAPYQGWSLQLTVTNHQWNRRKFKLLSKFSRREVKKQQFIPGREGTSRQKKDSVQGFGYILQLHYWAMWEQLHFQKILPQSVLYLFYNPKEQRDLRTLWKLSTPWACLGPPREATDNQNLTRGSVGDHSAES